MRLSSHTNTIFILKMKRTGTAPECFDSKKRFAFTEEEFTAIAQPKPPTSTAQSTEWARRNFEEWRSARNTSFPEDPVPVDLLGKANTDELNKWLSFFFLETRNQKGEKYPPKTLYQLMCGLLRYARLQIDPNYPNFLDVKNTSFRPLQNTMDNVFKQLRKEGIGAEKKTS